MSKVRNPNGTPENLTAPRFKPGHSGNPGGRPVGTKLRINKKFLETLADDFERYGRMAIARCRRKHPEAYLRALVALMPKEVDVTHVHNYDEKLLALLEGAIGEQQADGSGTDRDDSASTESLTH